MRRQPRQAVMDSELRHHPGDRAAAASLTGGNLAGVPGAADGASTALTVSVPAARKYRGEYSDSKSRVQLRSQERAAIFSVAVPSAETSFRRYRW